MMELFEAFLAALQDQPWALLAAQIGTLAAAVWLSDVVARFVLVRVVGRALRSLPGYWDEALIDHGVIPRLARAAPALVVHFGIGLAAGLPEALVLVVRGVASSYVVLTIALAFGRLLDAAGWLYGRVDADRAKARPIKGYLQMLKIGIALITGILIIATLFNRDPLLLLSGLGAMAAVLMLVFKDTLLSLVASVQLSSNDMLRVGDWIEMPQLHADGDVIDISLHTVKVRNWDKTITSIPTWRLINESYKNWRGMFESGGRRIKRALYLDQSSVRFLTEAERTHLQRIALLDDYLERKRGQLEEHNQHLLAAGKDPVNTRRVTNVGTFRAYVQAYLQSHPSINHDMTCMVRQLQPGPAGLPLELYCFTSTTKWAEYEGIQADIFDHLYAILPEFGLRVFQEPAGSDVRRALQEAAAGQGN
ncbi:MAG TPA: mechanosensitive ion channel family protein [Steroidobacteraceae bacterium]|nr:mechanosensitive ion channel family protein [Steroidobacteraceae bacterium]